MGSINQSKSFLAHGSLLREFTMGGYHGSLLQELTVGGSMIWLAVVGILNQSNAITLMSLLWLGALSNQNHFWPAGVYCGRLQQEFTTEVYHRSLPWKVTVGGYHRGLPWKFTMGGYHGSLPWEVAVGVYCRSLLWEVQWSDWLWWGYLTNQMP